MIDIEQLKQNPAQGVAIVVGALVLLKFLFTALKGIYAHFLRPGKNLKKLGEWGKFNCILLFFVLLIFVCT
jgi:hypothetical protein